MQKDVAATPTGYLDVGASGQKAAYAGLVSFLSVQIER